MSVSPEVSLLINGTHLQIDSRTVRITNKKRLQGWIDAYGLDSDFVRVRVWVSSRKGLMEFFSAAGYRRSHVPGSLH